MRDEQALPASGRALVALAGSVLLASLGISIATVALPTLASAFSGGVQKVQWVVLAYLLAVTIALVMAARMGDLYGHRRVLVAGITLFALASAGCAAAPSLDWLVAARVLQGLGAAVLMSLPLSIAKGLVPKARLGAAMGLLGTMSALGTAMGPALGGAVIGVLGWRAAFVVLALCGAGLLVLVPRDISDARTPAASPARIDWIGGLLLSVVLLCLALAATASRVGLAIQPWMLLAIAAVTLLVFWRIELGALHPLVPVVLVRTRPVAISLAMNVLVSAIMMSTLVVGPFFLSFGLGLDVAQTGVVMAAGPLAAALSGAPAGRVTDRFGAHRTLFAGLILAIVGVGCFAVLPTSTGIAGYVLALALMTPGFQLFLAANNTAALLDASDEHRGLISGLLGLSRNLGFLAGASLLPLLFASMLDGQAPAESAPDALGRAFATTFFVAAGLGVLAMGLALLRNDARCSPVWKAQQS